MFSLLHVYLYNLHNCHKLYCLMTILNLKIWILFLSTFVSKWHKSAKTKRQNHIVCRLIRKKEYCINQLLKQSYAPPELKSSLQTFYGCHHELLDRYEISISQMTMDLLLFTQIFFIPLSLPRLRPNLTVCFVYE